MSSDWSTYRLGDIAITQSGGTPNRSNNSFFNGEIPWVKSGELNDSTIYDSEEKISTEAIQSSSAKVFEPNTLLLAMYGATVGKTGILKIRAATNQAVCAIRPKKNNFYIEFLKFYLIFIRPRLLRERYGGAQPNISQTLIQDLQILLPLLEEQKTIATILLEIQTAIEIQESIIEKTRKLKKSTLHHIFTHGLRGEKLKETEIGQMPESWVLNRINILVLETNHTDPSKAPDRKIKYIDVSSISNIRYVIETWVYLLGKDAPSRARKVVEEGDVIVATVRPTLRRIAYITAEFNNEICSTAFCVLRARRDVLDQKYLFYAIQRDEFFAGLEKLQQGASYPAVADTDVKDQWIPLPSIDEQSEIAHCFQVIDQKMELHTAKRAALQDLFKTMLNKLMTGEIRVKDLDIDVSEVSA